MNNDCTLAYLAGAMDSDGFFTIRRDTYHKRVRKDASNPVYCERMGLKQVTPDIPNLLRDTFEGHLYQHKAQRENGKPLWVWIATDLRASNVAKALLPYLRVKRRQAELLLELRESKSSIYKHRAYWFEQEFPDWQNMELISIQETMRILGYTNPGSISQAIRNGLLVGLPYSNNYKDKGRPRVPKLLVERVADNLGKDGRARLLPPELIQWKDRLYRNIKELNKIGINGTPIYHQTGPYAPIE